MLGESLFLFVAEIPDLFPLELLPSKVPSRSGCLVHGSFQLEILNQHSRPQVEITVNYSLQILITVTQIVWPLPSATVLQLSTWMLSGWAIPILYATCTIALLQKPLATRFLEIHLAAQAAERSTFVGSLPEKAPPPCPPHPPQVSAMIFLPVSPASPLGPPMMKTLLGFRTYLVSTSHFSGTATLMTSLTRSSLICSFVTSGLCCCEIRIVCTRTGTILWPSFLYSTVTCTLASGRIQGTILPRLHSYNLRTNLLQRSCVSGMQDSVSSEAYPIIKPWSPAPISSSALLRCTPCAISGDCLSMATMIVAVLQSMPISTESQPTSLMACLATCSKLISPSALISPKTMQIEFFTALSHATFALGSLVRQASRMESEMQSQSLSGWPLVTLSEVKRK